MGGRSCPKANTGITHSAPPSHRLGITAHSSPLGVVKLKHEPQTPRPAPRSPNLLYIACVLSKFNNWVAVKITNGVSTMWCAYLFGAIALYGGTTVDWHNSFQVVQWLSQTFLQLVLLSIIMVGQKVLSTASDQQQKEMHDTVMESHKEIKRMMREMHAGMEAFHKEAKHRFELMHPDLERTIEAAQKTEP